MFRLARGRIVKVRSDVTNDQNPSFRLARGRIVKDVIQKARLGSFSEG